MVSTNRVLVLLVRHKCDIIKIVPSAESNIVMTIRRYEGLYEDGQPAVALCGGGDESRLRRRGDAGG